tara:strand:- start:967 stop:1587 length:621 start_codon:yes stop_codon:yes gene_type:complete
MDPYTALQIGQSVMGFIDANNQYKQQEAAAMQNRQRAAQARDFKVQSLNRRAIQEAEAAAGQQFEMELAALREAESRKVVDSGLEGQTEQLKLQDVQARELRAKDVISSNLDAVLDQLEDEKMGLNTEMQARIDNFPRGEKPSLLAAAIGGAASAYSAEADITGKNLFTGNPIARAKTNNALNLPVVPKLGTQNNLLGTSDFGFID